MFALVAIWEGLAPRRVRGFFRRTQWPGNLGIVALNTIALRFLFPIAALGPSAVVVVIFEIALNATAMFNPGPMEATPTSASTCPPGGTGCSGLTAPSRPDGYEGITIGINTSRAGRL